MSNPGKPTNIVASTASRTTRPARTASPRPARSAARVGDRARDRQPDEEPERDQQVRERDRAESRGASSAGAAGVSRGAAARGASDIAMTLAASARSRLRLLPSSVRANHVTPTMYTPDDPGEMQSRIPSSSASSGMSDKPEQHVEEPARGHRDRPERRSLRAAVVDQHRRDDAEREHQRLVVPLGCDREPAAPRKRESRGEQQHAEDDRGALPHAARRQRAERARLRVLREVEDVVPHHPGEVQATGREREQTYASQNESAGAASTAAATHAPSAMSANAVNTFGMRSSWANASKRARLMRVVYRPRRPPDRAAAVFPPRLCQFFLGVHVADVADALGEQPAVRFELVRSRPGRSGSP